MAQILDLGNVWKLILDENVNPVEEISKPEEGYRALIGESINNGLHTISYVEYNKEYQDLEGNLLNRTVDDILKKVEDLRNCERCSTLDKAKLNVDSIELQSPTPQGFMTQAPPVAVAEIPTTSNIFNSSAPPQPSSTPEPVKDMFSGILMDALLTDPGKYFLGTFLGDEKLVNAAIKNKKPEDFADEMFDFMEGNTDIIRSSDEAHDFISMIKDSRKTGTSTTKRKPTQMHGARTVIW